MKNHDLFSHFRALSALSDRQHRSGGVPARSSQTLLSWEPLFPVAGWNWMDPKNWVASVWTFPVVCFWFVASKRPAKTSPVVLRAGTLNTGSICLYVASAIKSEPFILKWLVGTPCWRTIGCQLVSPKLISNFHRFREGGHENFIASKHFVRKPNNFSLLVFDALKNVNSWEYSG